MGVLDWEVWPWNWNDDIPPPSQGTALGEIIGTVETISGIPAAGATVGVEGTPRGAVCDDNGVFDIRAIDPGSWTLSFSHQITETGETLTATRETSANGAFITSMPPILLSRPLSIGGTVRNVTAANWGDFYVSVPALNLAAHLSPSGTFVLNGLPPGRSRIVLQSFVPRPQWPRFGRILDVDVLTGPMQVFDGLQVPAS
jgi:Carboxypeptidase regulatory-like domain